MRTVLNRCETRMVTRPSSVGCCAPGRFAPDIEHRGSHAHLHGLFGQGGEYLLGQGRRDQIAHRGQYIVERRGLLEIPQGRKLPLDGRFELLAPDAQRLKALLQSLQFLGLRPQRLAELLASLADEIGNRVQVFLPQDRHLAIARAKFPLWYRPRGVCQRQCCARRLSRWGPPVH